MYLSNSLQILGAQVLQDACKMPFDESDPKHYFELADKIVVAVAYVRLCAQTNRDVPL